MQKRASPMSTLIVPNTIGRCPRYKRFTHFIYQTSRQGTLISNSKTSIPFGTLAECTA